MSLVLSPLVVAVHDKDNEDTMNTNYSDHSIPLLLLEDDSVENNNDDDDVVKQDVNDDHDDDDDVMNYDSTSMNDHDSAIAPSQPRQPILHGGLTNLGNTCYMNAAIQALASLDGLEGALLAQTDSYSTENNELNHAFLNLIQSIKSDTITTNPSDFKAIMDSKTSLFCGYRQQDSHEFITTLIDLLDEEYKSSMNDNDSSHMDCSDDNDGDEEEPKTASPPPSPPREISSFSRLQVDEIGHLLHGSSSRRRRSISLSNNSYTNTPLCKLVGGQQHVHTRSDGAFLQTTLSREEEEEIMTDAASCNAAATSTTDSVVVDDLFTTRIKVCMVCDSCNYTRHFVETHRHLSLDIDDEAANVQEAIRKFLAPQTLTIKCEECFAESATRTSEIEDLPRALLLHFKRFLLDQSNWTYRKNSARVEFDEKLDWNTMQYKLKAVVHHVGSSVHCGHYTSDALRQGRWFKYNDARVTETTNMDKTTAYMVLYEME